MLLIAVLKLLHCKTLFIYLFLFSNKKYKIIMYDKTQKKIYYEPIENNV